VVDDPNAMIARSDAGVGVGSNCEIPRAGHRGSIGDIGRGAPLDWRVSVLRVYSVACLIGFITSHGYSFKCTSDETESSCWAYRAAITVDCQLYRLRCSHSRKLNEVIRCTDCTRRFRS
jgi:hypothetical protein